MTRPQMDDLGTTVTDLGDRRIKKGTTRPELDNSSRRADLRILTLIKLFIFLFFKGF